MEYIKLSVESLEVIGLLGDAEKGRLFASLLEYAKTGEAPQLSGNERFVFPVLKSQIDQDAEEAEKAERISKARSEAGKKGAQAKTSKTQANVKQNSSKIKQNKHLPDLLDFADDLPEAREKEEGFPLCPPSPSSPEPPLSLSPYNPPSPEEKESVGADKPPATRTAPPRKRYGEYSNVLLSDEDLGKLKSEFPGDWEQRIERLSGYIASTGKTYKDHLATIRNWARKDAEKGGAQNGKAANAAVQTQRYGLYL